MGQRSGTEVRRLNRTTTIRWDDHSLAKLNGLADANARSVGEMVRWLVARAHRYLPRTQELSAELIQVRIALNILARALPAWNEEMLAELDDLIAEIEAILRDLR